MVRLKCPDVELTLRYIKKTPGPEQWSAFVTMVIKYMYMSMFLLKSQACLCEDTQEMG